MSDPFLERILRIGLLIATLDATAVGGGRQVLSPNPGLRREARAISFILNAPPDSSFTLFGPLEERKWAPHWSPRFVYPNDGSQTPDGAVFYTKGAASRETIWVMKTYDPVKREIEYVFVTPGHLAGELHIAVTPVAGGRSQAMIAYRFTALSETGNAFIAHWVAEFPNEGPHWAAAINNYLAAQTRGRR